jgi:hypothetical protein
MAGFGITQMIYGPICSGAAEWPQGEGLHTRRRNLQITMYGYTFPAECPGSNRDLSSLHETTRVCLLCYFLCPFFLLVIVPNTVKSFISIAVTMPGYRSREPLQRGTISLCRTVRQTGPHDQYACYNTPGTSYVDLDRALFVSCSMQSTYPALGGYKALHTSATPCLFVGPQCR